MIEIGRMGLGSKEKFSLDRRKGTSIEEREKELRKVHSQQVCRQRKESMSVRYFSYRHRNTLREANTVHIQIKLFKD